MPTPAGSLLALASATSASSALRPHIVYILADDLGWYNVGWMNPEIHSPNLDILAADGVILDRHYAYKYCSPSRSSLLSGRLPLHVNQNNECNTITSASGTDLRMTLLPAKLRAAGYATAMVGKWHLGGRSPANLPTSRGFDQHLGFLKGGEDHFDQTSHEGWDHVKRGVDLFGNGTPAVGRNGTYSAELYGAEAVRVVLAHDAARPLFLYVAFQEAHAPVQVPPAYVDPAWVAERSGYNGMVAAMDAAVGNLTAALRARGMTASTLVIFSADNGATSGGNNYPLRGMKTSSWEGGVRVAAFLWGGVRVLPTALRGTRHTGLIHICDWYATLSRVAGADPVDDAAGVPPPDSIDVWPSLMTPNATETNRSEVPLSWCPVEDDCTPSGWRPNGTAVLPVNAALIQGKYKLVWGRQLGKGVHWGPQSPNGTKVKPKDPGCPSGCLFDIFSDPTESVDVQADNPHQFNKMVTRLRDIGLGVYQTNYTDAAECMSGADMMAMYHGFLGPPCGVAPPR